MIINYLGEMILIGKNYLRYFTVTNVKLNTNVFVNTNVLPKIERCQCYLDKN